MPELPEVETIRRGLEEYLVGHKITRVEVRLPKMVKQGKARDVEGAKFKKVRRFGKALVMDLNPSTSSGQVPLSIVAHIKLTGQFVYEGPKVPRAARVPRVSRAIVGGDLPNKWTHVIFHLDRGATLYYNDVRQFGWLRILKTSEVEKLPFIHELGPEPLNGLTLKKFKEILEGKTTKIKAFLMDQKKIGGVGNIYANDALFLARIDPRRPAKDLSDTERTKLYRAIEKVLKKGLQHGGATELNYVNALGEPGGYQEHFLAYGREGEPCPNRCGGTFKKIKLGGRGTYYCPKCQK